MDGGGCFGENGNLQRFDLPPQGREQPAVFGNAGEPVGLNVGSGKFDVPAAITAHVHARHGLNAAFRRPSVQRLQKLAVGGADGINARIPAFFETFGIGGWWADFEQGNAALLLLERHRHRRAHEAAADNQGVVNHNIGFACDDTDYTSFYTSFRRPETLQNALPVAPAQAGARPEGQLQW